MNARHFFWPTTKYLILRQHAHRLGKAPLVQALVDEFDFVAERAPGFFYDILRKNLPPRHC